jgi:hypothetical protein
MRGKEANLQVASVKSLVLRSFYDKLQDCYIISKVIRSVPKVRLIHRQASWRCTITVSVCTIYEREFPPVVYRFLLYHVAATGWKCRS